MLEYIQEAIVPFVNNRREALGLNNDQPALAVFDHFKGQLTEKITNELEENYLHSVLIPASYTGLLQPMDISVNKVIKSFSCSKFSEWYSSELMEIFTNDEETTVDLSTARMKCVGSQWIVQVFEHLQDNPQIIVHGFRHAGIFDALGILDEDELPRYSSEEDSDIEENNTDEDAIQAMGSARSSLAVFIVYTDSDSDPSVDPIVLSSSEGNTSTSPYLWLATCNCM